MPLDLETDLWVWMAGGVVMGKCLTSKRDEPPFRNPAELCEDLSNQHDDDLNPPHHISDFKMRVWKNAGWWD